MRGSRMRFPNCVCHGVSYTRDLLIAWPSGATPRTTRGPASKHRDWPPHHTRSHTASPRITHRGHDRPVLHKVVECADDLQVCPQHLRAAWTGEGALRPHYHDSIRCHFTQAQGSLAPDCLPQHAWGPAMNSTCLRGTALLKAVPRSSSKLLYAVQTMITIRQSCLEALRQTCMAHPPWCSRSARARASRPTASARCCGCGASASSPPCPLL